MKKIRVILIVSLLINIISVPYAIRKGYQTYRQSKGKINTDERQKVYSLFPIDTSDVVFLGDSQMQYFSTEDFFPDQNIVNRGISGDDTFGVLKRFNSIISGKPKKIFIYVGTNDIYREIMDVKSSLNNMKIIINQSKRYPQTKLYIQSVCPFGKKHSDNIKSFNAGLKLLCDENNITFIDTYNIFSDSDNLRTQFDSGDGVHLSAKGYVKWAEILKSYL